MEMEAVEAVYGDEAVIVDSYPPHLHLHIKPRTAEISSQQVLNDSFKKIESFLRIGDCQIRVVVDRTKSFDFYVNRCFVL